MGLVVANLAAAPLFIFQASGLKPLKYSARAKSIALYSRKASVRPGSFMAVRKRRPVVLE